MTIQSSNGATAPETFEIVWLRRISQSQPTAWEGRTSSARKVHVSYLYGLLEVEVWEPSNSRPDWGTWRVIVRLRPREMELNVQCGSGDGKRRNIVGARNQQVRMELQGQIIREIRSSVWSQHGGRSRVISLRELAGWLDSREKHFDLLRAHGLVGGGARVKVTAITDGVA